MANRGDWIQLHSGRPFWPLSPSAEDVDIGDIAHALSLLCRFNGHCREFYSVAQHSLLVAEIVARRVPDRPNLIFAALLHDASEAYVGDLVRPIKRTEALREYRHAEARVQGAIEDRYSLPRGALAHAVIGTADDQALVTEARDLLGDPAWARGFDVRPLTDTIRPLPPSDVEILFLDRFVEFDRARPRQLALEEEAADA